MTNRLIGFKQKLILLVVSLLATLGVLAETNEGQTVFQVNESFNVFQTDLARVYGRWDSSPTFDKLDWCLKGANSGFVFLYCNGLDYSVVFDSESFLLDNSSSSDAGDQLKILLDETTDYRVQEKMGEDKVKPSLIQDLQTVGNALTVISKDKQNSGQVLLIMYTDSEDNASSQDSKMIVDARKTNFNANQHVLSAWANSEFLLYHAFSKKIGQEDIIVYYYQSASDKNGVQVTDLNLYQNPEQPKHTELIYDVIKTSEDQYGRDNYTIYVVAKFSDMSDPNIWTQTLYEHEIARTGNKKNHIKSQVDLNDICVDQIKVFDKLIVVVCAETRKIAYIDRLKLQLLEQNVITLPETEIFTRVENFGEKSVTGGGSELIYKSEYAQILEREGHMTVFITTQNTETGLFKFQSVEIIVHNYEENSTLGTKEMQAVFQNPQKTATEILQSSSQMHHLKFTDSSISINVEGESQISTTLPNCFLDQFLSPSAQTCEQCPLGAYGLTPQSTQCISCAYLNSIDILETHLMEKLQFLCQHKIGQISSTNRGVYSASSYPSQREFASEWRDIMISLGIDPEDFGEIDDEGSGITDSETITISDGDDDKDDDETDLNDGDGTKDSGDGQSQTENETGNSSNDSQNQGAGSDDLVTKEEEEKDEEEPAISSLVTILITTLGVIFLVPWIIIAIVQIRKRVRRNNIQKQKEFQQQQMLRITDYGREIRRSQRGPQGEQYNEADAREARFRKVDKFAPEHLYKDCKDIKKSQTTCAICVEDFIDKDVTRMTSCNHLFHSQCLMMWAKSKIWSNVRRMGAPCCPNCNASLINQVELPTVAEAPLLGAENAAAGANGAQDHHRRNSQQQQQMMMQQQSQQVILIDQDNQEGQLLNNVAGGRQQYQTTNYFNAQSIDQMNNQLPNVAVNLDDYVNEDIRRQGMLLTQQQLQNQQEMYELNQNQAQVIANLSDDGIQIVRTLHPEEAMQLGLINQVRQNVFDRRANSQRDLNAPQTIEAQAIENGHESDFANRSLPIVLTAAQHQHNNTNIQQMPQVSGWATLQKLPNQGMQLQSMSGPQAFPNRALAPQGDSAVASGQISDQSPQVHYTSFHNRNRQRHLEVISEDEGAMQQLGANRMMLEQVAKNTREQIAAQDSDGSSTNVYLQRKQRILDAINKQNQQLSDGYASITEQPIFAQIDAGSRASHDNNHQSNKVLPSVHDQQFSGQPEPLGTHHVIAVTSSKKLMGRGQSGKILPFYQHQSSQIPANYLSSDDQSLQPGMISLPKVHNKELRLRTVFGGRESGYVSSTTNHQKPQMLAVENISQGQYPVMHSDIESVGGTTGFAQRRQVLRMQDSFTPGHRSISVRNELQNNYSSSKHNEKQVIVNGAMQQNPSSQQQIHYGGISNNNNGKGSIRSLTLQNQGAFAVGVAGYSVVKSRDFTSRKPDSGRLQSAGQTPTGVQRNLQNNLENVKIGGASGADGANSTSEHKQYTTHAIVQQSQNNNQYEVASGPTISVHNQGNINADRQSLLSVTHSDRKPLNPTIEDGATPNGAKIMMTKYNQDAMSHEQDGIGANVMVQDHQEMINQTNNDNIEEETKKNNELQYMTENENMVESKQRHQMQDMKRAILSQRSMTNQLVHDTNNEI